MADLDGRTAIVTGGARGIGRAACEQLAERGCRLVVNHNSSQAAAGEVVAAVNAGGGEAIAVAGSIADPATGPALASAAMEAFGRIDILVNNAGVTRDATVRKMSDEDFTSVIDVNLTGTHRVTRAVVEPMCAAGFGRIHRVELRRRARQLRPGKLRGSQGRADRADEVRRAQARPLRRHGQLRLPGVHRHRHAGRRARADPGAAARAGAARPLRTADEIARAVVFVASEGDYMTGTCLDINGGLFM